MRKINEETLALGKEYEGLKLEAYPDPGSGNDPWTIGYGHTGLMTAPKVVKGMSITEDQANQYFINDMNYAGDRVSALVTVPINDNQYGALTLFYINVGEATFAKSSVLSYVNQGKFDSVPGRLALYRMASGKVMTGLVRRRAAEGALFMKPVDNVVVPPIEVGSNKPATPDRNDKKPWDWGAAGALATVLASLSGDIKTVINNITEAVGLPAWQFLVIAGVCFFGWTLYNKFKKET